MPLGLRMALCQSNAPLYGVTGSGGGPEGLLLLLLLCTPLPQSTNLELWGPYLDDACVAPVQAGGQASHIKAHTTTDGNDGLLAPVRCRVQARHSISQGRSLLQTHRGLECHCSIWGHCLLSYISRPRFIKAHSSAEHSAAEPAFHSSCVSHCWYRGCDILNRSALPNAMACIEYSPAYYNMTCPPPVDFEVLQGLSNGSDQLQLLVLLTRGQRQQPSLHTMVGKVLQGKGAFV
jgi:hypothetical protein